MPERPRLHLDFTSPCTPPPTYSPYTYPYTTSPTSYSPSPGSRSPTQRRSSTSTSSSTSRSRSDSDSFSSSSSSAPGTPRTPSEKSSRIVMGAYVSSPEGTIDDLEGSLEVPGIVLTEPPKPATPRLPSPPPKQVVLLAPVSLPIPTSPKIPTHVSLSSRDLKSFSSPSLNSNGPQFSPAFMALIQPQKPKGHNLKTILLLLMLILGGWHLWCTLEMGNVVEDALEVF
ncbi:hypothetical protein IAT40_004581 [Kwoniella sp. CBS 6097]